jgi:hypothetical protein
MEMLPLSSDIEKRLALLFSPDDQEEARRMLVEECGTNIPAWKSAGVDRLRCAVLKLSDGKILLLRRAINVAKIDFRDVLVPAEFGEPESHKSWTPERKW